MPVRNHAEALRRLGELLEKVETCVLAKCDAAGDAWEPTQAKKAAFDAQFTALFSKVRNRENLSTEQFFADVNNKIKPALEDWIATDGLPCQTGTLLDEALEPFPGGVVINP